MTEFPINTPEVFGNAHITSAPGVMTVIDAVAEAPAAQPEHARPTAKRHLQADGANIILFTFTKGQTLNEHKAAHPIAVECVKGELEFTCRDNTVTLRPGTVVHLTDHLVHRVDCNAEGENVLLLTMLTGERHQS